MINHSARSKGIWMSWSNPRWATSLVLFIFERKEINLREDASWFLLLNWRRWWGLSKMISPRNWIRDNLLALYPFFFLTAINIAAVVVIERKHFVHTPPCNFVLFFFRFSGEGKEREMCLSWNESLTKRNLHFIGLLACPLFFLSYLLPRLFLSVFSFFFCCYLK